MFSRQLVRGAQSRTPVRWFTRNSIMRDQPHKSSETDGVIGTRMHRVTDFDKRILVWVKRYPSIADVPKDVTVDCLLTARSRARIKACNYMIAFTIVGCIISVMIGKRHAERGETLSKLRQDWYNETLAKDKKG